MFNALHPTASGKRFNISYEFFPPKTEEMEKQLWESVKRLEALNPHFVSVTYGAGGSTRERTHAIVERIAGETRMKPAAHLTCVSSSVAEIDDILREYWAAGVRHIVALRGDADMMTDVLNDLLLAAEGGAVAGQRNICCFIKVLDVERGNLGCC